MQRTAANNPIQPIPSHQPTITPQQICLNTAYDNFVTANNAVNAKYAESYRDYMAGGGIVGGVVGRDLFTGLVTAAVGGVVRTAFAFTGTEAAERRAIADAYGRVARVSSAPTIDRHGFLDGRPGSHGISTHTFTLIFACTINSGGAPWSRGVRDPGIDTVCTMRSLTSAGAHAPALSAVEGSRRVRDPRL